MNAASSRFIAVFFLLAPTLFCAGTPTTAHPPLTVLVDFDAPHSETSLQSLRQSLSHILGPTGIPVDVQVKQDLPANPQFGQLVIFKMKGSCSLEQTLPIGALSDERGPLAMAYTSDGDVLHFGEVECDRVRRSIQRVIGLKATLRNQRAYGSALAIVIAHELYHMLGNARNHTQSGLTKPALSGSELANSKLAMPPRAFAIISKYLHN